MLESTVEQIIADFHDRPLPSLTPRSARLPWLEGKIDTVIGMRRSGKTWFMYQKMQQLLDSGQDKESLLYLNFEDDRLWPLGTEDLARIVEIYYRLFPSLRQHECSFFFDEIHVVPGWERFVRRLVDTEQVHLCLTGSSARLLSSEIASSLRGRSISTEIFPFGLAEAMRHAGIDAVGKKRSSRARASRFANVLRSYLLKGGFPEVQAMETEHHRRVLQDYLNVVILRDIVERHEVTNTLALRHLISHLINAPSQLFSVNKLYNVLKSQGVSVSKDSLHRYLAHLTDAFLFFTVDIHTRSERARQVNPKKVYAIDPGLVYACAKKPQPDWGHLLENFVFMELRRRGATVEYYRSRQGFELDFVVTDGHGSRSLIQVCTDIRHPPTRQRELRAIEAAQKELGLDKATVITFEEEDRFATDSGEVEAVPAWRWAFALDA